MAVTKLLEEYVPSGDPRKGMEAVYKFASLEDPPGLRFPLGKDAVEIYREKATQLHEAADKYASWSDNLDKTS